MFHHLYILSLIVFVIFANATKRELLLELVIPWPSGIMIDRIEGRPINDLDNSHNHFEANTSVQMREIFRVGRNQHNVISLRPQWSGVHIVEKVLTDVQCQAIIKRAEEFAANYGWSKKRHVDYDIRPTQDLSVSTMYSIPNATEADAEKVGNLAAMFSKLKNKLESRILSKFAAKFGLDKSEIHIDDLFLTKYDANLPPKHMLGPHRDKSLWSFVVALNDDFEGGGTYFFDAQERWRPPQGAALVFSGQALHGGSPITNGVRYILAGFMDSLDPLSHATFMKHYDPIYDGYAAQYGFHSGDVILGIQVCELRQDQQIHQVSIANDGTTATMPLSDVSGTKSITRRMFDVTPSTTDDEWQWAATSCEQLAPGEASVFRVRRFVNEE